MFELRALCSAISVIHLIVSASTQNVAFDCASDQSNYTSLSLLGVGECLYSDDDFTEEDTEIQLLQQKEAAFIPTFSCLINLDYVIEYCGMSSHNSLVKGGVVSETYRLTGEECRRMHEFRTAKIYGQEFQIARFNETLTKPITLAGEIALDGACSGGSFSNERGDYRNVVAHGQVSFMFSSGTAVRVIKEDKVRLNSGITCAMTEDGCLDPTYGFTFWRITDIFPCSEDAYHVIYSGPATKVTTSRADMNALSRTQNAIFSVKQPDQIFTLTTVGSKNVCHLTLFQTEHPKYLIAEAQNGNFFFAKRPIPVTDLDMFLYVNAKIMHITSGIERAMKSMYKLLTVEMCELEREHLKTLQTLAFISPVSFAYQYMGNPGYTAISSGEVIHVIKCHPVSIKPRADEDCTIEYPVYYRNESYYVTPRSHLLQKTGTPSPCASALAPEYNFGGKWFRSQRGMMPSSAPITLSPKKPATWAGLDLGNVMLAGIYTSAQLDEMRHQIMYPQERRAISEKFASVVNGDSVSHSQLDYTAVFDEEKLKNKFHDWWLETWGWFRWLGDFGSIFFSLYVIYLIFTRTLSAMFRLKAMHELFGCSVILITSIVDGVSEYILHKNAHKFQFRHDNGVDLVCAPSAPERVELSPKSLSSDLDAHFVEMPGVTYPR